MIFFSKMTSTNSYILPYSLIFTTGGGLLTYITDKPVFLIASIPLGIGAGMIRGNNVQADMNKTSSNSIGNSIVKSTFIYVLGVPALLIALSAGVMLSIK